MQSIPFLAHAARAVWRRAACLTAIAGMGTAAADYPAAVNALHPAGYWRLNETAATVPDPTCANSGSGAGLQGTYLNNPAKGVEGALVGDSATAVAFASASSQAMAIPYSAQLNPSGAFTAEIWAFPTVADTNYRCICSSGAFGNDRSGWLIYQIGNAWEARLYTGTGMTADIIQGPATTGAWQHLALVYDGATTFTLYINGVVANTLSKSNYLTGQSGYTAVGGRWLTESSAFYNSFDGQADEFAFYPTALSGATLLAHSNNGRNSPTRTQTYQALVAASNPVGYWRLNEAALVYPMVVNSGTLGALANGPYVEGTFTNAAGPAGLPGLSPNTAVRFNGKALINCGNDTGFDFTTALSVAAWVKADAMRQNMTIVAKGSLWQLRVDDQNNRLKWIYPDGSVTGTKSVTDGQWHHVVAVAGPSGAALYVDGALDAANDGTAVTLATDTSPVTLASDGSALGLSINNPPFTLLQTTRWNGSLDEVAVFGNELPPAAVSTLYAAAAPPTKDILSFGPGATVTTTDATHGTIHWTVPNGSNQSDLAPAFTLATGATCDHASGSSYDFTNPVHYLVTAAGGTKDYLVTVTVWDVPSVAINVNIHTSAATGVRSDIAGPAGILDINKTWNQLQKSVPWAADKITGSNLLDSAGAATTTGLALISAGDPTPWGGTLAMLQAGAYNPGFGGGIYYYDMVQRFTGLTSGKVYNLYVASYYQNENGSKGVFYTSNPTSNGANQPLDNGAKNSSSFVQGNNYVLFQNIVADANGEISFTTNVATGGGRNPKIMLSGFQLVDLYPTLPAGNRYWAPAAGGGGSGTWNAASLVWTTTAGTQGTAAQSTTAALIFGNAVGTVTVNGTVTVSKGLEFSTNGYVLAAGTNPNIALAGAPGSNPVTVDAAVTATLNAPISGSNGLTKDGAGHLVLGSANPLSGAATLSAGTLTLKHQNALQTATLTLSGGSVAFDSAVAGNAFTLGGLAGSGPLSLLNNAGAPAAIVLTVGGNNVSASYSGVLSGNGSLVKTGSATQTLASSNTYSGNTTVNAGTLELAAGAQLKFVIGDSSGVNNRLSGMGMVILNGNFAIDTTATAALTTGTWTLVEVDSLTESFGPSFGVVGFTPNGDGVTWSRIELGKRWTFVTSTGVLSLTPTTVPAVFSGLSPSQSIAAGTAYVTLTGTLSDGGALYPAHGEPLTVTINGVTRDTTINGGVGWFTLDFPTASIPGRPMPYPITYRYAGNITSLGAAPDDASTSLTVIFTDPYPAWIKTYFPTPGDPRTGRTADPDGDGKTNQDEYAFGLDPNNSASVNPITVRLNKTTGTFSYTRRASPATTGIAYTVWTSTTLAAGGWTQDAGATEGAITTTGDVETVSVTLSGSKPLPATKLFVRVKAVPPP